MIVNKPWGHEDIIDDTSHYTLKLLHVLPGHRLSLQYHESKRESLYVLEGHMHLTLEGQDKLMPPVASITILPKQQHRIKCHGQEKLIVLEAASGEHLTDVVRLYDDYDRHK